MSRSRPATAFLALALGFPAAAQNPSPQVDAQPASPHVETVAALDYFKPVTPAAIRAVKIADAAGTLPISILVALDAPPAGPARDAFIARHGFPGTDIAKTSATIDRAQDLLTRVTGAFGKGIATMSDAEGDRLVEDLAKARDGEDELKTFKIDDLKIAQATLAQKVLVTFMRDSSTGIALLNTNLATSGDSAKSSRIFVEARDTARQAMLAHTGIKTIDAMQDKLHLLTIAIDLNFRSELLDRERAMALAIAGTDQPDTVMEKRFTAADLLVAKTQRNQQSIILGLWQQQHRAIKPLGLPVQASLRPVGPGVWLRLPRPEPLWHASAPPFAG